MTSIPDLLESSASQNHLPPSNIEKTNSTSKDTLDHDNLHSDTFHENQPDNLSNQSTDSPQENPPDSEFPTQPETLADFGNFDDFSSYSKQKIETTKDAFGDFPVGDEPAKPNSNNDDFGNFGDFPETSNQPSTQVVQLNGNDSFADFADFSSSKPTQNQSIQDDFSFGEFPSDSNHQKTANDNNFGDFGNFPESTASETPATSSNNKTSQNTTNSNTADQNSDPFFSSSTNQNRQSEDFFSEFPNSSNNQNNSNFPAEFPVSQKKNFPEKVSRRLVVGPIEDFMDLCGNILEDYSTTISKPRKITPPNQNPRLPPPTSNSISKQQPTTKSFTPLHNYVKSTTTVNNDPDGINDRLSINQNDYANSLYSAVNATSNECVFQYKWEKTKFKKKYFETRDELIQTNQQQ